MKLAPYAMKDDCSRGRLHREKTHDKRSIFEKDRDRIIHCEAFRMLEYKTQVFVNHADDYYRTRLTHSIEVAQISRSIAKQLHLNCDLVEAIALAHDLGHTPFGHTGEFVLNSIMRNDGGFEHNRQTFRVVTELEKRYPEYDGLNLSYETLEGIIKHSTAYDVPDNSGLGELFDLTLQPTLEAQIIDLADEIAYLNHDLDDGLFSGLIVPEDLADLSLWQKSKKTVMRRYGTVKDDAVLRYRVISEIISFLIKDLVAQTKKNITKSGLMSAEDGRKAERRLVCLSDSTEKEKAQIRRFLFDKMYCHTEVEKMKIGAENCLKNLFDIYSHFPSVIPEKYTRNSANNGLKRCIADYIASMTDRTALKEYKRLHGGI